MCVCITSLHISVLKHTTTKKYQTKIFFTVKKRIRIDFNGRTMSKFYIFGSELNFMKTYVLYVP